MRRIFLGLVIALLTFGIGALFVGQKRHKNIASYGSSFQWTSSDGGRMAHNHDLLSSPLEATENFNAALQRAADFMEFTPCFDTSGRRIGERAVMLLLPPQVPEATWRIMWTQQQDNFSELFWVESPSLADTRAFETIERQGWKKCVSTK